MKSNHRQYLFDGMRAGVRYAFCPPRGAPAGLAGSHLANRPGSSLEFMDHRAYQAGDDLRRIDWSAYARSDRLSVKLFREEVNPHVDILLDCSRSMDLPSAGKAGAALSLAALLASAAGNAGYSHALWLGKQSWLAAPNGSAAPTAWDGIDFDYAPTADGAGYAASPRWRARSIRVLISDLLWLADPSVVLSGLSNAAAAVAIVQVLAREDADPPPHGNIRLLDSETDEHMELFIDAAARQRYRDALSRHQQNWNRSARQCGAAMTTIVAEDFLSDHALGDLLSAGVLKVE